MPLQIVHNRRMFSSVESCPSNRAVNFFGFMPSVTYIHTNRYSDISLYSFTSDRVILGATQNF